jgi:hypothetical protein
MVHRTRYVERDDAVDGVAARMFGGLQREAEVVAGGCAG